MPTPPNSPALSFDDPAPRPAPILLANVRENLLPLPKECTFSPKISKAAERLSRPATAQASAKWAARRQERLNEAKLALEKKHGASFSPKVNKSARFPASSIPVFERLSRPSARSARPDGEQNTPPRDAADDQPAGHAGAGSPPKKNPARLYELAMMQQRAKEQAVAQLDRDARRAREVHITDRNQRLAMLAWARRVKAAFEQCDGYDANAGTIPIASFDQALLFLGWAASKQHDAPLLSRVRDEVGHRDGRAHVGALLRLVERAFGQTPSSGGNAEEDAFMQQVVRLCCAPASKPVPPAPARAVSPGKFTPGTLQRFEALRVGRDLRVASQRASRRLEETAECTFQPALVASQVAAPPPGAPVHLRLYSQAMAQEQARRDRAAQELAERERAEREVCTFSPALGGPSKQQPDAAASSAWRAPPPPPPPLPRMDEHLRRLRVAREHREQQARRVEQLGQAAARPWEPAPAVAALRDEPDLVLRVALGGGRTEELGLRRGQDPQAASALFAARFGLDAGTAVKLAELVIEAMAANDLLVDAAASGEEESDTGTEAGWELHHDGEARRWFFHHPARQISSWTRPPGCPRASDLPYAVLR
jgi:hypothetical protein